MGRGIIFVSLVVLAMVAIMICKALVGVAGLCL